MLARDGFFFISNSLALDFLNTQPVLDGQPKELLGSFSDLLRWYVAAGLLPKVFAKELDRRWGNSLEADVVRLELLEFRERLRAEVFRVEAGRGVQPEMIAELNRLLAAHPMPLRIVSTKDGFAEEFHFDPKAPADLFGPVARAVADLFTRFDSKRIRKCQTCVLHFYDTTKNATRRWCSMEMCGNRSKVASYAARHRH